MPPFFIRRKGKTRMHKHLTWTDRLKIEKALKEGLKTGADFFGVQELPPISYKNSLLLFIQKILHLCSKHSTFI